MLLVHRELTERIRSVRRLDLYLQDRIQATALLLSHIQASQAPVRSITLQKIHQARRLAAT